MIPVQREEGVWCVWVGGVHGCGITMVIVQSNTDPSPFIIVRDWTIRTPQDSLKDMCGLPTAKPKRKYTSYQQVCVCVCDL